MLPCKLFLTPGATSKDRKHMSMEERLLTSNGSITNKGNIYPKRSDIYEPRTATWPTWTLNGACSSEHVHTYIESTIEKDEMDLVHDFCSTLQRQALPSIGC